MTSMKILTTQCLLLLFYLVRLATAIPSPDTLTHTAPLRRTNSILEGWRVLRPPTRLAQTANDATVQRVNVTLSDGTGVANGVKYPQWGIDAFLGIPFAQPPTGDLRFNKPQPLSQDSTRVIDASQYGVACIQATDASSAIGEDCLSINVVRPSGIPSDTSLPVVVFIYGGSLTSGASSSYNSTLLVIQSMMRGQPIIYASFNYRLGALGFLASTDIATAAAAGTASLNSGLYDMQLALQWVQNNIGAFGGDKAKVTVYGQSAGAISIGSLLVADGGQAVSNLSLFRAAILESGAPQGEDVPFPNATDSVYASFISAAGCSSTPTLACLREASAQTILSASETVSDASDVINPYNRVIDGYFHDRLPSESVSSGRVAIVPLISGNVLDEGTDFAPTDITDDAGVEAYFADQAFTGATTSFPSVLQQVLQLYPDDPSQGSPYDPTNTTTSYRFYGGTNQYKRLSSLMGDLLFQSGRRALLQVYTAQNSSFPVYSYLFATNTPDSNPTTGVAHGSDLNYVYGVIAETALTSAWGNASLTMMNAWINFAWNMNPNGDNVPTWPLYGSKAQMLQINLTDYTIITDDYRKDGIDFLKSTTWTTPLAI